MSTPRPQKYDARLPGAWIASDQLAAALSAAGRGGFGAWIREAIDAKLKRDSTAQKRAHNCAKACAP